MSDIGGNVCIRDGEITDYCWRQAVESLLPICDTVTICDGGSTDGTLEAIQEWQKTEPKIRLLNWPWPNPKGMDHFWVTWLNFCRERIPNFWHLQLDADEVLHESSYRWIEDFTRTERDQSAVCERLNFWKDPWHIVPDGKVCGTNVVRLGPTKHWMPTDYPHPWGDHLLRISMPSPIKIAHYGMIRPRKAMMEKQRRFQVWTFGSLDPRVETADKSENWYDSMAAQCGWASEIREYRGTHPFIAHRWLKQRGFNPHHPTKPCLMP